MQEKIWYSRRALLMQEQSSSSTYLWINIQVVDALWMTLGVLLVIGGIAGSFLPLLPGPPLAYAALLIQQFRTDAPYSTKFLLIWAAIVIIILVLDFLVPMYGTKKYGGSKYGMWGCAIGFLLAFWMGPLGVIFGPLIGAFIGEMIYQQNTQKALRAAKGAFLGFLFGSLLKFISCFAMGYYLIWSF
jgi:uncharacterized protein YqgC (DUF456 family)